MEKGHILIDPRAVYLVKRLSLSGGEGNSSSLPLRAILMLEWAGRKRCRIKKIKEPDVFRIEEAENIKLLCGDIGKIENVMPGYPLVIRDCNRGGQEIGTYTGAIKEGIHSITPIYDSN